MNTYQFLTISIAASLSLTACVAPTKYSTTSDAGSKILLTSNNVSALTFDPEKVALFEPVAAIDIAFPEYYRSAIDAGISGTVKVRLGIGLDGKVKAIELPNAPSATLAYAVTIAATQWRFKPLAIKSPSPDLKMLWATQEFTFQIQYAQTGEIETREKKELPVSKQKGKTCGSSINIVKEGSAIYPSAAQMKYEQGEVKVAFDVQKDGKVSNLRIDNIESPALTAMSVFATLTTRLSVAGEPGNEFPCRALRSFIYTLP